jgi:hypothetical protein
MNEDVKGQKKREKSAGLRIATAREARKKGMRAA